MDYVKAPGERFELSDPCEYVLCGYSFPGTRPTRLGDPGSDFRQISFRCKTDYILRYLVCRIFFLKCVLNRIQIQNIDNNRTDKFYLIIKY